MTGSFAESTLATVRSVECTGCLDCVAVCPVQDTLELNVGTRTVSPLAYAAAILIFFFAGYSGARAAGLWENSITDTEYVERIQNIDSGEYAHPGIDGPETSRAGSR